MYNIDVPILDEKVTLRPWLPALVLLSGWNWLEPPRHPSRNVSTAIPFSAFASLPPLGKLFDEHTRSSLFFERSYKSVFFLVNIKPPLHLLLRPFTLPRAANVSWADHKKTLFVCQ